MKLAFTKMHGAGNDFVVIDGVFEQAYDDSYLPFLDVFESAS
jgi:diaminopimelate epimerase